MNNNSLLSKYFKSSEEAVSMFLGLVIVIVVVGMVFNFFQKRRGEVTVPGVSDNLVLSETKKSDEVKSEPGVYVVKKGDSLWKIAEENYKSGYKWKEIAKANNLKSNTLEVGQKLTLATTVVEEKAVVVTEVTTYKVVKGDSLWKIAVANYGDGYKWVSIWKNNKNKLRDPNKLEIGMLLALPKLN